jgi:hypothetical protein
MVSATLNIIIPVIKTRRDPNNGSCIRKPTVIIVAGNRLSAAEL